MQPSNYTSDDIEVLTGLDPVKKRPGMYTDTQRPNHLAQEIIDNSVDEAIAGHANKIEVTLHEDNSLEVSDNGRGMPVDIHPEQGISGVEVIMTKLHAGGKFSNKNYQFSGGLHGVGISVVNALSTRVEVEIRRDGAIHNIAFTQGDCSEPLTQSGNCKKSDTGTRVRFWPEAGYFDTVKFSISKLQHILRAKAVLCANLHVIFNNKQTGETLEWRYENGLTDYLLQAASHSETLPKNGFIGEFSAATEALSWALLWDPDTTDLINESYVNLIPTATGGTHVNGLRSGLIEAMKEFCEFRNLLPRGLKLTADDLWENCAYVLSIKMQDPQFSGQTKERLSSRQCASFVSNIIKDDFSLWLNQHTLEGEKIAEIAINRAHRRLKKAKKVARKKVTQGPALPGKLADCLSHDLTQSELFLVEGDSAGGSAKQARDKDFQAIMPLRGKILNTWEIDSSQILSSNEIHDIAVAMGIDPNSDDLTQLRYGKICVLADADSDGLHIATLLCALFLKHFKPLVKAGHVFIAMPPLYRIDIGKHVYYALDDSEKQSIINKIHLEKKRGNINVQRFKGLGEMNPMQLRETTMAVDTRRLVQLTLDDEALTSELIDKLLAKKRAPDRKIWLESSGDQAII